MPSSYAQSAHTLPRNFTFHYRDGQPPKTPEPVDRDEQKQSPPPPAPPARDYGEPYRLRRRRPPVSNLQRSYRAVYPDDGPNTSSDVPIPSVEVSNAPTGFQHIATTATESNGLYAMSVRPWSPPKTPVAQLYDSNDVGERDEADLGGEDSSSQGDSLTRPSTACSGFSDSSKSSSVESFPSLAGCASPESDMNNVFGFPDLKANPISSPLQPYGLSTAESIHVQPKPSFTEEMDDHLWITYMRYLQDPTHTPFKMLPGTAPPPGVCSRVVREAKRTWRGPRQSTVPRAYKFARWGSNRAVSPEIIRSDAEGSTSPLGNDVRKYNTPWPRSDAATRRRLKELCKRKLTLSAHYNRILHTRSPSPFLSSVRSRSASMAREVLSPYPRSDDSNSFSTRDMNISLATSLSSTMHFGNPLSQLTSDTATPRPRAVTQFELPSGRSPGHQKSQSLHNGIGSQQRSGRGLASPFRPTVLPQPSWATSRDDIQSTSSSSAGLHLAPPVELHAPMPRLGFFKRPAQQELEDVMNSEDPVTRQNHLLKELFGPPPTAEPTAHRRVRSRGFSLGDMSSSARLSNLFAPPTSEPVDGMTQTPSVGAPLAPSLAPSSTHNSLLPPPSIDVVMRLGSPFAEKPGKPYFNTFPRNFAFSGMEPTMETEERSADTSMKFPI